MYRITYDPVRQLLSTAVEGLLTPEQARAFADEWTRQMLTLAKQRQPFKVLVDGSRAPVQSQASYQEFQDIGQVIKTPAPTAIVMASTLGKIQASRNITYETVRIFQTVGEAQRWLASVQPRVMEVREEALA